MGLFSFMKSQFIEKIEWTDTSSQTIVHPIPFANQFIKMGAILTVKETQVAVVVNEGKVADVFGPGRYTLSQENLPILSVQRLWKVGFNSPFRAELFYVNTKQFTDMKWGTVNPLMIKTPDFGNIRVKVNGTFTFRVMNTERFMKEIFGTNQIYDTPYMIGQFKSKLIAGLTEVLNETKMPVTDFAAHYDEISENAENKLQEQFAAHGLELCSFIIENIILPQEMGTVAAVKEISIEAPEIQTPETETAETEVAVLIEHTEVDLEAVAVLTEEPIGVQQESILIKCHECGHPMVIGMKFCSDCGIEAKQEYPCSCGYVLNHKMKFCPNCGVKV
jgi:membrane protease subunit (stomatin/prohibitin family)